MKINLYYNETTHQKHHLNLFRQGLKRHDIVADACPVDKIGKCDLAVIWSAHHQQIIDRQKADENDYIIMERGFFGNRMRMTSIGFNGLNGRANFLNKNSPADRWLEHGLIYADWKTSGDYILIMGQVLGDASLKNVDFIRWIRQANYELKFKYDMPIRCRPHPLGGPGRQGPCHDMDEISKNTLAEDLRRAFCVVTFNSTAGVDAILAGVPVIACDLGSMAWPVAAHGLEDILRRPERKQWARDLAYCQWTEIEIKNGTAWDHLKQKYEAS